MIKLLKYQFRKLVQSKLAYIFFALQFVYLLMNAGLYKLMMNSMGGDLGGDDLMGGLLSFSTTGVDFMLTSVYKGLTITLLGVFVALFVCGDRSNDVLKNIYARGYTPTRVMISEYICVLVYGAVFCIFSWLAGISLGCAFFETGTAYGGKTAALLVLQLFNTFAYVSLFFFIAKSVAKMGGVIILNIVIPMVAELLFTVLDMVLTKQEIALSKYWLDGVYGVLSKGSSTAKDIGIAFVTSFIYCTLFTVLSYVLNRKRAA